jgi:hypothetical protein
MSRFITTPDFSAEQLVLEPAEQAVYAQLCSQRQCTSAELIRRCAIKNPHAIIEQINAKLDAAQSQWHVFSSATRPPARGHTQSMRTPLGYYRLLRKTSFSTAPSA